MNSKKFISLLFVTMLFASSFVFAANNKRNVYSVFSDNFNGAHSYDYDTAIPSTEQDAIRFDIWSGTMFSENITSTDEDVAPEGKQYTRYTWGSSNWTGCGYTCYNNIGTTSFDMSAYVGGEIKFIVRSSCTAVQNCRVGIKLGPNTSDEIWKTLSELGFDSTNTGWQELTIPLNSATSSLISSKLSTTTILFMVSQNTQVHQGDILDIDNIRWVKQNAGQVFSVVRKKVSDNTDAGQQKITFSSSTFGQGWSVAEQYLELDIDGEIESNNWSIRVYTEDKNKAGLYNGSDVLPTAWRVSCSTLPYTTADTYNSLEIGEKWDKGVLCGLYDAGMGDEWVFPWFWFKNYTDGQTAVDSIVWCYKGCCTFANTPEGQTVPVYNYEPLTNFYERKPKLYFACKTTEAKAVIYGALFILNLRYE